MRRLVAALLALAVVLIGPAASSAAEATPSSSQSTIYAYDAAHDTSDLKSDHSLDRVAVEARHGPPTDSARAVSAVSSVFVAAETAGSADTIVLGHYPEYVDVAKATGGRTFQVPTKVWDSMTSEEQWGANQKFLDRAIARGSNVQLATPANAAREGSYFERELQYMQSKGYTVGPDGMSLLPPGSG